MIPVDDAEVLDKAIELLQRYATASNAKGRFVAIYLGLKRMGDLMAPLGSSYFTPMEQIQEYLDQMWVKVHRRDGRDVLTAPFGGSGSAVGGGYSARTGAIAPGLTTATNTWRNNFGIQKGVGCVAPAREIADLVAYPDPRPRCRHLGQDSEGHFCRLAETRYRGEEHSIWVAKRKEGYQVVDLDAAEAYRSYLQPSGVKIPVYPLIAVLYCLAVPGFYPHRSTVGITDFAEDFGYSVDDVETEFDCETDSTINREMIAYIADRDPVLVRRSLAADTLLDPAISVPELREAIQLNDGLKAELAVRDELLRLGWEVEYVGNRRELGYDLLASKGEEMLRVEVKSSIGFVTPELTENEWRAAKNHGDSFVLAAVDFVGTDNQALHFVRDPASSFMPTEIQTVTYRIRRSDMDDLSTDSDFL